MTPRQQKTRKRVLQAAAEIYAQEGYRNARVQDICERAGANIAAVNYYFGDKERLYQEVLAYAFQEITGADPVAWDAGPEASPEERLSAFIRSILTQLLSDDRAALLAKLVTRELADPTEALDRIIEAGIRPQVAALLSIIREIVGKDAGDERVRRCASSVLGQCLFYHFARSVICRVELEPRLDPSALEPLADHITRFSLAGMRHIR